jgi:hypothetical protein
LNRTQEETKDYEIIDMQSFVFNIIEILETRGE